MLDDNPKPKSRYRRSFSIDLVSPLQLEECIVRLKEAGRTTKPYIVFYPDRSDYFEQFTMTLYRGQLEAGRGIITLHRWEGTSTRIKGIMEFSKLSIHQPSLVILYVIVVVSVLILLIVGLLETQFLSSGVAARRLALTFGSLVIAGVAYFIFLLLSEYLERRRMTALLKQILGDESSEST